MKIIVWSMAVIYLLLAGSGVGSVAAQTSDCPQATQPIAYGDQITGDITSDTVFVFYCFQGQKGDQIVIDVEAMRGNLDPYVMLSDIKVENFYAENDNLSPRNLDSHIDFTLEEDARYVISVTRIHGNKGDTLGSFRLTLENQATSSPSPHINVSAGEGGQCVAGSNMLIPGYAISSVLDDDNYLRSYCFYGLKGMEYRMSVETTKDDLDPMVFVTTPDLQTVIDSNDNASTRTRDARLDFVPDADGVYLLLVARADLDKGKTAGEYRLSLDNRTTNTPGTCADALTFPSQGVTLERAKDVFLHVYCYNGTAGERVTFSATAQKGSLDMVLFITAANLDPIEQGESKDTSLDVTATLPDDGPYLLIVFDLTGSGQIDMTFTGVS